jgi:hypothetical protein
MPIIDFDMGLASRVGDIYPSPGIPVEFMPEELFERKRIVDKLNKKETFSFLSFWRSGFTFDASRWDPSTTFDSEFGHFNDATKTIATIYSIFPVVFDYSFIFWDTKRENIDFYSAYLFKSLYLNPITTVTASDTVGLVMRCYMDFEYKLNITDEYVLEKSEKVPYFKGKFGFKLEGWLYNISTVDVIHHVHTFTYNQHRFFIEDIWVPDPESGYISGESGLPSGADLDLNIDVDTEVIEVI